MGRMVPLLLLLRPLRLLPLHLLLHLLLPLLPLPSLLFPRAPRR